MLAVNGYDEPREEVREYLEKNELKQKVLLMGGKVAREKFAVRGFPTTFLIDRQGIIVHRDVGFLSLLAAARETRIRELLERSSEGDTKKE